jgi:uncharacterized protein with PIN domain
MFTKERFDKLPYGQVFATGVLANSPDGIFMTRDGGELRWVAKKGWGNDWAIYCHWADKTVEWVTEHGDKVYTEEYIKRCVQCDDELFNMYRF